MRRLRKNILLSFVLLDALILFIEYLIPVMGSRRDTGVLHDLLGRSINLLDTTKQKGSATIFNDFLLTLGIAIIRRVVQSPVTSSFRGALDNVERFGAALTSMWRNLVQIGVTNVQTAVYTFQQYLDATQKAFQAVFQSLSDPYRSSLDGFRALGTLGQPLAWLYVCFIIYSQAKMMHNFARFIQWAVGIPFQKARSLAIPASPTPDFIEAELAAIFGGQKRDDSFVTPRSSRRRKNALGLGERVARKDVRDIISQELELELVD